MVFYPWYYIIDQRYELQDQSCDSYLLSEIFNKILKQNHKANTLIYGVVWKMYIFSIMVQIVAVLS